MQNRSFLSSMLRRNTLKTVIAYLYSLLERALPIRLSRNSINGIYNHVAIDEFISTSGQPTKAQFKSIKEEGYLNVINLAPHDAENALNDEKGLLGSLEMTYQHIPVNFDKPTKENFDTFVEAMDNLSGQKVWVHCAANMRVSAFIYRYRYSHLGVKNQTARRDLQKIWEPFGVWAKFVNNVTRPDS